jgi:hypothetical protein
MSIIDINQMSPLELVTQYVVETLGSGHCLSRDDVSRVEMWLQSSANPDELLLLLEDILPEKVAKAQMLGRKITSLSLVNKTVQKRLKERALLIGGTQHGH